MIFLDLDHTLVHTVDFQLGKDRTALVVDDELFYAQLRPFAHTFLEDCRTLAPTKLLTSATRAYAHAHNDAFSLGFESKDILAREDYLYRTTLAYGSQTCLLHTKISPCGVLVDNLPPEDPHAQNKQRFLGIPTSQYFQIRQYNGHPDPEVFGNEVKILLETLKAHFKTLKPTSKP